MKSIKKEEYDELNETLCGYVLNGMCHMTTDEFEVSDDEALTFEIKKLRIAIQEFEKNTSCTIHLNTNW